MGVNGKEVKNSVYGSLLIYTNRPFLVRTKVRGAPVLSIVCENENMSRVTVRDSNVIYMTLVKGTGPKGRSTHWNSFSRL